MVFSVLFSFTGFLRPTEEVSETNISFGVIKNYFHSMMVWFAWEPPLYTHSTSHSRWTRNQRATSMIFGTSTQTTWMKKRKPQKQGLTGLDFEINGKNCQKMSKNAKNRENWSFAMSCSSETSMVRGGFFLHHFKDNAWENNHRKFGDHSTLIFFPIIR